MIGRIYNAVVSRFGDYVKEKIYKAVSFEVAELFFQHNGERGFNRYDMIVRLLAVENYFGKNNYGFDFYRRMQAARINEEWVEPAVERFKNLIKSYEENGYDETSKIIVDRNLHLFDGSHRMAMAMYYGIKYINATVLPDEYNIFYGIEWFKMNGFSEDECAILHSKFEELKEKHTTLFICTLWSPVNQYYDEITEHLKMFGDIKEVRDYVFNERDYIFYTRGIYHVDDIEKWKIEKKISYMLKSSPNSHKLRMVSLYLNNPDFRLKAKTNTTLSKRCELIKKLVRDAYKGKVDCYFHDIIMHIGDNFYQNRYIYKLLTMPAIDINSILSHIKNRKYIVTKFDVPYMPDDFPAHYPLGKDLDIICQDEEEYNEVLNSILADVEQYKDYYDIRIVKKSKIRTLVRLEQKDQFLVFQFDVSTRHRTGSNAPDFIDDMVFSRQEMGGFYVPQTKYEILIRLQELKDYPNKKHHKDYVMQNIDDIDEQLCDKYLKYNWRKLIK